jgi:2-iminobutanoate/2-iminopropanoate deaminase
MQPVTPPEFPPPAGHYSPAVVSGGFVFVSGQLPVVPETGERLAGADIEAQARQVFVNIAAILAAAGSGLDRVVRVTVYLTDIELWGRFNAAYAAIFGDHRPARTVVPVPALHHGVAIEVDVIAAVSR